MVIWSSSARMTPENSPNRVERSPRIIGYFEFWSSSYFFNQLQYYLSLNNEQLPVESQLLSSLVDVVNAECVSGAIQSRRDCVDFLKQTYLQIRMLKNPKLYQIDDQELENDPELLQRRVNLSHTALAALDKYQLVQYDRRTKSNPLAGWTMGSHLVLHIIRWK